ncbi:MAG: DNRLRE domain-containing protein [Chloroflexota bacterium]
MKSRRFFVYLAAALAMVLSLTYAQPAGAFLPRGKNLAASTPPYLSNIQAIDLGGYHTCALTTSGGVKCWGDNSDGQLGDGTTIGSLIPVDVFKLTSGVLAVSAGRYYTCALNSKGGVKCWGANWFGQLGDDTHLFRRTPVDVSGLSSGVIEISAGGSHTCALTDTGGVKCWGWNLSGQLGDGTTIDHNTPGDVSGLTSGAIAISAGSSHTCVLMDVGGVKCWGGNSGGQLGDGTTIGSLIPVDVSGLGGEVQAISAGGGHTCALTDTGGVKCWGENDFGQLGDGTYTSRKTPVDVQGLTSGVLAISTGSVHTCALTSGGGVKCWGWNGSGQLGDGTATKRSSPVDVIGLASGMKAVSAGGNHTCAIISNDGVKCWGWNENGQLGDGTTTRRLVPVNVLALQELVFRSLGQYDGFVWESTETSNIGLRGDNTSTTFSIGDDNADRQYRTILSFNTESLPDDAVITRIALRIKQSTTVGVDPFTTHGGLKVDIRKPYFGTTAILAPSDFQVTASRPAVGAFGIAPVNGWYTAVLTSASYPYLNLAGTTQFRLRFQLDDNDDMSADYTKFFSGNYTVASYRPTIIIDYFVP